MAEMTAPELAAAAAGDPDPAQFQGYLARYGYSAADAEKWVDASQQESIPTLELSVTGHEEQDGHTWYIFGCSVLLPGEAVPFSWESRQRLGALRERWHDPVKATFRDYDFHFQPTPFASKGGLPGTTARLQGWCGTLVSCINRFVLPPSIVFLTFQFLEAPEPPTNKSAWGNACQATATVSLAGAPPDAEQQEQPLEQQQQQQQPVTSAWAASLAEQRDASEVATAPEAAESSAAVPLPQQETSDALIEATANEQQPRDDTADTSPVRSTG